MKLKKIMKYCKEPKRILLFLDSKGLFKWMPDKWYLKFFFKINMRKKLNLEYPYTYNEKIQWLKLYDRNPLYNKLVDKYEVKKYVADLIGYEYIIPSIDVYDKFEEIDFDKLPNQFVLKCTHDSGGLVICKDKNNFDKEMARKKIKKSLKNNYFYNGREWPYKNVKPRIIAEQYMKDDTNNFLTDYKFFCFNGEPKYLYVSEGLDNHSTARMDFFDMDFKPAEFYRPDYARLQHMPTKPTNFEKMKEISRKLSKDMSFVRVDLYEIDQKIYFSELTFSPCSGYMRIKPEEWDLKLGNMLNLPK